MMSKVVKYSGTLNIWLPWSIRKFSLKSISRIAHPDREHALCQTRVFDFPDEQDLLWYLWIVMVYVKQSVWFPRCTRPAVIFVDWNGLCQTEFWFPRCTRSAVIFVDWNGYFCQTDFSISQMYKSCCVFMWSGMFMVEFIEHSDHMPLCC